jgi:phosphate transport system substrate-binding protein
MQGRGILIGLVASWLIAGCGGGANKGTQETPTMGTINISVDESFRPVIDSEIKVFESSFPDVKIIPHYKAEAECLRDLTTDSTRMVIVTRGLTTGEEKFYTDSFHLDPTFGILAYDAIAVIINKASKDSIFQIKDIQNMLNGTDLKHQPVMDGVAKSSEGVIDYVATNPNAVGFVGVSWIGNLQDTTHSSFLSKVDIAALRCTSCGGETYVKPYQANIALRRYPLVRSLYYILKENYSGVGNNFVNFLQYERGQLIFYKAYLYPAKMPFEIRDAQISQ